MSIRIFIFWLFCFIPTIMVGQIPDEVEESDTTNIYVKNTDNFIRDASQSPSVQYLRGNVKMYQDSIFMFCDSAILVQNNLTAIGNVIIIHEDSIKVFADSLVYFGDSRKAELYNNVVLENGDQKLFSNELFYDLNNKIATYSDTAYMQNSRALVKSIKGRYDVEKDLAKFEHEVTVKDSVFQMETDSLLYNTKTDIARFISYTQIFKDDQIITCSSGYYNLQNDEALFGSNATLKDSESTATAHEIKYIGSTELLILTGNADYRKQDEHAQGDKITFEQSTDMVILEGNAQYVSDSQSVKGELIKFNRKTEDLDVQGAGEINNESLSIRANNFSFDQTLNLGVAEGAVSWIDTVDHFQIDGEKILYNDSTSYIRAERIGDTRPLFSNQIDEDTIYISSDTLEFYNSFTEIDSLNPIVDTIKHFTANKDVKVLFADMSAICGKLDYNDADSAFVLQSSPMIWTDSIQFFADTIYIHMVDDKVDRMRLINKSMMITQIQDRYYNQIVGKTFNAVFDSSVIKTMEVKGSSQSLYFMQEEDEAFIALNKTVCSYMTFYFDQKEIEDIKFYEDPTSKLLPMKKVKDGDLYLEGFSWQLEKKPNSIKDLLVAERIVILSPKSEGDEQKKEGDLPIDESDNKAEKAKEKIKSNSAPIDSDTAKELRNLKNKTKPNEAKKPKG